MYFVFACAGTAGHIYPALAMADMLRKEYPEARFVFYGSEKGMENRLVREAGYEIRPLTVHGIRRKITRANLKAVAETIAAARRCRREMKRQRPDLVVATGGYITFPVIRAAASLGIPTAVHESNAQPGMAVRLVAKVATRVWLGREAAASRLPSACHCVYTGTPVRKEFLLQNNACIRANFGVPAHAFLVLSFGGSLGAEPINRAMLGVMEEMKDDRRFFFIHIAGRGHLPASSPSSHAQVWEYTDRMPDCMRAADLVICRSGALTVSELCAAAKPSILIPSPHVTEDHQTANARVLAEAGAAYMIPEAELTASALADKIRKLGEDPAARRRMAEAAHGFFCPDTEKTLLREMRSLFWHSF